MGKLETIGAEDVELNFSALMSALFRAKIRIVLFVLIAAAAAYAFVNIQTPVYQSETRILIENRETTFTKPQAALQGQGDGSNVLSEEAVASQVQIITARDLVRNVVRKFELGKLPEFDPALKGISSLKSILVGLGIARDPMMMSAEERILDNFYKRLTVYRIEKSRVIVVQFRSEDAELSAKVANAVAEEYLAWQQAAKAENTRDATEWLKGEIDSLRKRVADAEAKVAEFRTGSDLLVGSNNTTLNTQQLTELSTQLTKLRAEKTEARAKANQIRSLLSSGGSLDSVSEVMNSPLIQRLQEQRVTQKGRIAELSITLLPGHPRIKELNAQLADLERQIRNEASRYARGLENDASIAAAREESVNQEMATLKASASRAGEQEVDLRALEREAKAQRDLLESFLARYREAAARESAEDLPADARIISSASAPSEPTYPKKLPTILAVTIASFILSILVVLTRALLSGAALTVREPAEHDLGVPLVAAAPAAAPDPDAAELDDDEAPPIAIDKPLPVGASDPVAAAAAPVASHGALAADAVWSLAHLTDRIAWAGDGSGARMIAVAGAGRAVGGARAAVSLARSIAATGASVVLVDANPHRPELAALVSAGRFPGLSDLMRGNASFGQVIFRDRSSRAHFISSGLSEPINAAIAGSARFREVFEALTQTYDQVIIDVGNALDVGVADAAAGLADVVVLASRGGPEESATVKAYDRLQELTDAELIVVSTAAARAAPAAKPRRRQSAEAA